MLREGSSLQERTEQLQGAFDLRKEGGGGGFRVPLGAGRGEYLARAGVALTGRPHEVSDGVKEVPEGALTRPLGTPLGRSSRRGGGPAAGVGDGVGRGGWGGVGRRVGRGMGGLGGDALREHQPEAVLVLLRLRGLKGRGWGLLGAGLGLSDRLRLWLRGFANPTHLLGELRELELRMLVGDVGDVHRRDAERRDEARGGCARREGEKCSVIKGMLPNGRHDKCLRIIGITRNGRDGKC